MDWWIVKYNNYSKVIHDRARELGVPFWAYSPYITGEQDNIVRYYVGLWTWKYGLDGILLWAYRHDKDNMILDDGTWQAKTQFNFSISTPDGPASAIGLEGFHEGTVDYRILRQLQEEIAKHPRHPQAQAMSRWLQHIADHCGSDAWIATVPSPKDPFNLRNYEAPQPGDFDHTRVTAIKCIERLRTARTKDVP